MIKAIVLDIDGVIVGNNEGVNFPQPSKIVSEIIRNIHDKGIPVSFLSGKPSFTAAENIRTVGIDNPHIADGGAVIFNPIQNEIIHVSSAPSVEIHKLLKNIENEYFYLFTTEGYYLREDLENSFSKMYSKFAGRDPVLVSGFESIIQKENITKINIYAYDDNDKKRIESIVKKFPNLKHSNWSTNPIIDPVQVMVITSKKVSKRDGVKYLAKYLNVSLDEVLGVGDTMHDWEFLEICGYKGVMKNASDQLKEMIDLDDSQSYVGGHVNEDGIINIFEYFELI